MYGVPEKKAENVSAVRMVMLVRGREVAAVAAAAVPTSNKIALYKMTKRLFL